MKDKNLLLKELDEKFNLIKNELGFKSSFEDIDRIFFVRDFVLHDGFVSEDFSRQLCSQIMNTYLSWANYLHGLVMPNPSYIIGTTEMKAVSDSESKNKIWGLIKGAMVFASTNSLIGLNKDKTAEARFIDEAVLHWNSKFKPEAIKILEKVCANWRS